MKLNNDVDNFHVLDSINHPENSHNRGVFDNSVNAELNSYRNWHEFGLQAEPLIDDDSKTGPDNWWYKKNNMNYIGTKALFNNINGIFKGDDKNSQLRFAMNAPLLDSQVIRNKLRERGGCSIRDLVEASSNGSMGRAIYNYSDFMYCKHLGKISNNYLITLRRFPFPAGDHINYSLTGINGPDKDEAVVNQHMPDIGRLVTWMGTPGNDMNEILKYTVKIPFKELTAEVQDDNRNADATGGILGTIMNMTNPSYTRGTVEGSCGTSAISTLSGLLGSAPFVGRFAGGLLKAPEDTDWKYYKDSNKAYGPVDAITKTHIRAGGEDGGLEFDQSINLSFDYEMRSYDGINGRAAFLDLLANILVVTYTQGRFWGGGYRSTGAAQSSVFTNLPIFHLKGGESYNQLKDAGLESLKQVFTAANGGKTFSFSSFADWKSLLSNMWSNVGQILLGGALNALGRPQKLALDSLLKSDPVGMWHLTIGNPKHPIMSMGNMILDNVEIQHYGPLDINDFPTGLRVNVTLKHAMPRDQLRIEQMYGLGDNRIYMPAGNNIRLMYDTSETYKMKSKDQPNLKEQSEAINNETTTGLADDNTKNRLMKYFGMDNEYLIDMTAREGHLGSNKVDPKPTEADMKSLSGENGSGNSSNSSNDEDTL